MNFKFANLLGSPYRGGNLLIAGSDLLSIGGNRILQVRITAVSSAGLSTLCSVLAFELVQVDLNESAGSALPFESLGQLRTLCLSPDGVLLLAVDTEGKALLINRKRQVLLHHFSFKGPVAAAKFSPDGQFIACAVQRLVQVLSQNTVGQTRQLMAHRMFLIAACMQVWRTPAFEKSMTPMHLHRTYGQCHADVTALDWSEDSQWLAAVSKDLAARCLCIAELCTASWAYEQTHMCTQMCLLSGDTTGDNTGKKAHLSTHVHLLMCQMAFSQQCLWLHLGNCLCLL